MQRVTSDAGVPADHAVDRMKHSDNFVNLIYDLFTKINFYPRYNIHKPIVAIQIDPLG
jgi:hypothetical protein